MKPSIKISSTQKITFSFENPDNRNLDQDNAIKYSVECNNKVESDIDSQRLQTHHEIMDKKRT